MGIAINYLSILFLWSLFVFSHSSSTQNSVLLNLCHHFFHDPESTPLWNASANPCTWVGVICTNNSVTQLHLSNFDINNSSFLSIACQIQSLQVLAVSDNFLDSIPDDFITICGKLPRLKSVDFSGNSISGKLPSFNKGGFTNLESLHLSCNQLNGSIGAQFDGLVALKSLKLGSNQLTGSIPSNLFGNLKGLQEVDLSYNHFQGIIPEHFPHCNNLTYLDLSYNKLTGTIPADIGLCQELLSLNLAENRLSGELPTELGNLKQLQWLNLKVNSFVGLIPSIFEDMLQLTYLNLSGNKLSGNIPSRLGSGNLSSLDLSYNNLSGSIPPMLQKFTYKAFAGNLDLCGQPVTASCDIVKGGDDEDEDEGKGNFYIGLYVSIGLGFYFGFWGVCGTLALKHTWRYAFFSFIYSVYNRMYVTIAIYVARLQRKCLT